MGAALALFFGISLSAPAAYAQTIRPPNPGIPGSFPVGITYNVYQEVEKQIDGFFDTLTIGGIVVLMNAFQVFTQKIAYDTAQAILTGDVGKTPLFYEKGFGTYLEEAGLAAAEQFVSSINEEVFIPSLGLDICQPVDPFGLQLTLGIRPAAQLAARCTFKDIANAFEQTLANIGESDERLMEIATQAFNPASNDIGVNFAVQAAFQNRLAQVHEDSILSRIEPSGVKPVTNFLSGKIKTPKQAVMDTFSETNVVKMVLEGKTNIFNNLVQDAFELGFSQIAVLTASTFIGTLATGALQKIFDGLKPDGATVVGGVDLLNPETLANRNVARVRLIYSDLLTPNLFTTEKRDFVVELSSCPTPRGTFNCAMDDVFATLFRTETGAFTVSQAAHMTGDGAPPANPQFLHPDWELIPEWEVKDNTDATCYQRAYCAGNLAKLRYARILPVGWELAANSQFNKKKNGRYVTLGEVIRGFNVCNENGEADSSHPWCKLVDPNWIVAAPPFQCRVEGFGDSVFAGTSLRLQECSDAVSCLKRDDRGNCIGGYGFCVAEKPVWRFKADACEARFASCRTYVNRASEAVSYLRNTIDYGSCSADSVGCLWYATELDPNASTGTAAWVGTLADGPRIYLDATAEPCAANDAGCTALKRMEPGISALNLVRNGSFDAAVEGQEGSLAEWTYAGNAPVLSEESSIHGDRSYAAANNALTSGRMAIVPLRTYVLSAYVRNATSTKPGDLSLTVNLAKTGISESPVVAVDAGPFYRSEGCTVADPKKSVAPGFEASFAASADNTVWQRLECTFVSNTSTRSGVVEIVGTDLLVDSVQLEEAEVATAYVEGVNGALTTEHLKVPPEELACTGNEATDNPLCKNYARVCRQQDNGCQGYRDVDHPAAPEIPATLSAVDVCPAACVGYAEYLKQPSTFDLTANIDDRLNDPQDDTVAAFIPNRANACEVADVGCEAFTNVEATTAGGEDVAYFNYVRACEKPGPNTETYFTWEGSDTTGYQLRTWSLIHDPSQTPPPPKIIQKAGPERFLKEPLFCNEQTWQEGSDPDCRQFYNANGDVFYRYFSQTVLSSPSCVDYRKDVSNPADCEKTGGTFNAQTNDCVYKVLASESNVCRAEAAGCRAYLGATGRNTATIFEESFRNATTSLFTSGDLSNEAILVGDSSLKLSGQGPHATLTTFPSAPNQLYKVTFWMKTVPPAPGNGRVVVNGEDVGTFPFAADWRRYEVGPFSVATTGTTSNIAWIDLPDATFLDEIRIERLNDVTFVVKDSWVTPAVCDMTPEGVPEPQAMLGCRAYTDRNQRQVTVRRFGQLCGERAVGCTGYVDTRNSANPYEDTFVIGGTNVNTKVSPEAQAWESKYLGATTTTRPADRYVYVIDEPAAHCSAEAASCKAFGKPNFTQAVNALESPQTAAFDTVYFKDDITKYVTADGEPNMLCRKDELFCDSFTSGQTVAYFRNPGDHACEWRDKVNLKANPAAGIPADGEYNGWFRTGADVPCYPAFLSSGNTFLIQNSGDAGYTGWAGNCPVEQSECTEFRDPNDHSDPLHPSAKPYYFIKNSRVDVTSCNGQVDLLNGCILFNDLSDTRLKYNTGATYKKSRDEGDTAQQPIDCANDPDNPYCTSCKTPKLDCGTGPWPSFGPCNKCNQTPPPPGQKCMPEATQFIPTSKNIANAINQFNNTACTADADCSINLGGTQGTVVGTCSPGAVNNANVVLKVNLDRDCAEWLGCATAETVFDPVQQKYVDVCTETALCDETKGSNAGVFCGNYVNRNNEEILKPGEFFSRELYVSRPTGFGKKDYSGYAVPDQFQAADIQNREVGKELFYQTPALANKFVNDFRLVAAVPESGGMLEFAANDNTPLNPLYPDLLLCRNTQTGRTGYKNPGGAIGKRICYFPVDALSVRNDELVQDPGSVDPRNMEVLADIFRSSVDPRNDITLQRSFPPAECKAHPEANAPFPNTYVKEWDFSTEPFKPEAVAQGYGAATLCEYGEDCSCSYRKVKYGGGQVTKYYEAFGAPPAATGVCSGGVNNGRTCVPGESQQINTLTGDVVASLGSENPACPGGRCLEISDVALVRGQFGQCLQRDYSRSVAGDPGRHPCLIWNPNPILSGTYDTYHYIPTAGYTPPVNAGEYYCLSQAQPPFESVWDMHSYTFWEDARDSGDVFGTGIGDGGNQFFMLPGSLSKLNYDPGYIAGQCNDDIMDTCGAGETTCTCHDGSTNIKAADADYESLWAACDHGVQEACAVIQKAKNTDAFSYIPVIGVILNEINNSNELQALLGESDREDCREDPIDNACDEIWRFTNLGQGIDGVKPFDGGAESPQATHCQLAMTGDETDDMEGPPGKTRIPHDGIGPWEFPPDMDYQLGRWIQTGRGIGRTQTEYFVPVKPQGVARWLLQDASASPELIAELAKTATRERNFAQFQFFPKLDGVTAACSIPPEYVDGVSVNNWTDVTQVAQASNQVFTAFQRDFDGKLDRSKEHILEDESGKPIQLTCSGLNDNHGHDPALNQSANQDGQCYYKYWETNYRMDGVPKFQWLEQNDYQSFYERHNSFYGQQRECSKSGFAIRAMFENANNGQNSIPADQVTGGQLTGPWNFIGFWITACTAGTEFEQSLYLGLRVRHSDICQQIGQVVSPDSRENAAFADRTWQNGSFSVPKLGFNYQTDFPPFGSSLATGIPGTEPLFMTGGFVQDYSILKPPTFLGAGASYVTLDASPLHKWSHLTNIFARVYRIYKFYDRGVDRTGRACIGGPNDGAACPTPLGENDPIWQANADKTCGGIGTCNDNLTSLTVKNQIRRCNGLSGVNAGLTCGSAAPMPSLDPLCHNAPVKRVGTALVPQYVSCKLRENLGWQKCENGQYANPGKNIGKCGSNSFAAKEAHEKYNAFGCDSEAVIPGAGCSAPAAESKDCPLRIDLNDIPCIPDNFGPMAGHCGGGYDHARCSTPLDCVFTSAQWWGAYDDGKPKTDVLNNLNQKLAGEHLGAAFYPPDGGAPPQGFFALPFVGLFRCVPGEQGCFPLNQIKDSLGAYYTDPFAYYSRNGALQPIKPSDVQFLQRWPSSHPVVAYEEGYLNDPLPPGFNEASDGSGYQPGLCEGPFGSQQDPNSHLSTRPSGSPNIVHNSQRTFSYHRNPLYALRTGVCDGGVNVGNLCFSSSDVPVTSLWPHPNTCASQKTAGFDPYTDKGREFCKSVAVENNDGSWSPVPDACKFENPDQGDPFSPDPDLDNNACTRSAGYAPWSAVCGKDPTNEKCLIGYDLADVTSISLDQTKALAPTDVTPGLHVPSFLGLPNANPADETHIAYYGPTPPTVAAPDLSRTCAAPGSCPISLMNRFTIEEQSEGVVSFAGGQGQVAMRFYGWASQDQTPLKEVTIDWGDGVVTRVTDARMKNKKPFCGGTRECTNVPGLTCNSDADCPPAAGACRDIGTCSQNPSIRCFSNAQCEIAGKKGDTCQTRQFFGNSNDACEANYFEFSHAYACDPTVLAPCGTALRCSGNPSRVCTTAADCGSGDSCVPGLAPSSVEGGTGGCFDQVKNACRFTPKLMLKDNWNWCTGECRGGPVLGGVPTDLPNSIVRHLNGGCWDGTETRSNIADAQPPAPVVPSEPLMKSNLNDLSQFDTNECSLSASPELNKNIRPWIVFPGSVNVGVFQ